MSKEKIKVFTGSGSFNPGEDLQQKFVEDAPQQVNELANVENLSKFVIELVRMLCSSFVAVETYEIQLLKLLSSSIFQY